MVVGLDQAISNQLKVKQILDTNYYNGATNEVLTVNANNECEWLPVGNSGNMEYINLVQPARDVYFPPVDDVSGSIFKYNPEKNDNYFLQAYQQKIFRFNNYPTGLNNIYFQNGIPSHNMVIQGEGVSSPIAVGDTDVSSCKFGEIVFGSDTQVLFDPCNLRSFIDNNFYRGFALNPSLPMINGDVSSNWGIATVNAILKIEIEYVLTFANTNNNEYSIDLQHWAAPTIGVGTPTTLKSSFNIVTRKTDEQIVNDSQFIYIRCFIPSLNINVGDVFRPTISCLSTSNHAITDGFYGITISYLPV